MAMIDVFTGNAFSLARMTRAIETAPYTPRLVGQLGLFKDEPQTTTVIGIEKMKGKRALLRIANRGTVMDMRSTSPRTMVDFRIPHVPYFQPVMADDVQNIRAFGKDSELEVLADHINKQLAEMKKDHEATHEFHRVSAIKGIVYDADNTTVIYNYFSQFGLSQTTVAWKTTDASFVPTTDLIIRTMADKLGNEVFTGIVALCGKTYFNAVIDHVSVQAAYNRWRDGEFFRYSHLGPEFFKGSTFNGFVFQDIMFVNYRGAIGNVTFIPDAEAYYVPMGIDGLFLDAIAPAPFAETVNTLGKRFYARQAMMEFNLGVKLHTQSNVLSIPTRPDTIIKSTWAAA